MRHQLHKKRQRYTHLAATLDAMSPLKVLGRGYAIAERADGIIIKTSTDVNPGDQIKIKLQKDEINCITT